MRSLVIIKILYQRIWNGSSHSTAHLTGINHVDTVSAVAHESGYSFTLRGSGTVVICIEHIGPVESRLRQIKAQTVVVASGIYRARTTLGIGMHFHSLGHGRSHTAGHCMLAVNLGCKIVVRSTLVPACLHHRLYRGILRSLSNRHASHTPLGELLYLGSIIFKPGLHIVRH